MATQLNSSIGQGVTVASVLAKKGRNFTTGFMDEFDIEAERAASHIQRIRNMVPQKLGKRNAGFGRAQNHPNADRHNLAMIG